MEWWGMYNKNSDITSIPQGIFHSSTAGPGIGVFGGESPEMDLP